MRLSVLLTLAPKQIELLNEGVLHERPGLCVYCSDQYGSACVDRCRQCPEDKTETDQDHQSRKKTVKPVSPPRATCFPKPADPTDCTLGDIAATRRTIVADDIVARYANSRGTIRQADIDCYLSSANYWSRCESRPCSELRIQVKKPLSMGWIEETTLEFSGVPGKCNYDKKWTGRSTSIISPTGIVVIKTMIAAGRRKYMFARNPQCHTRSGRATERSIVVSELGLLFTDWTDSGKNSQHWAKRAEVLQRANPSLAARSEDRLHIRWPSGAFIEVDAEGFIKNSNFIANSSWENCRTDIDKDAKHFFPALELQNNQKFGRIQPGFIKQ